MLLGFQRSSGTNRPQPRLAWMDILITLLLLAAIFAIVWWAITNMGLPQPARILVVAVMAIVALIILFRLMPSGALHF